MKKLRYIRIGYKGYVGRVKKKYEREIIKLNQRIRKDRREREKIKEGIDYYKKIYKALMLEYEKIKKLYVECIQQRGIPRIERPGIIPEPVIDNKFLIGKFIINHFGIMDEIMDIDDIPRVLYKWLEGQIIFDDNEINEYWNNFMKFIVEIIEKIKIYPLLFEIDNQNKHIGISVFERNDMSLMVKIVATIQKLWWTIQEKYINIYIDLEYFIPVIEMSDG